MKQLFMCIVLALVVLCATESSGGEDSLVSQFKGQQALAAVGLQESSALQDSEMQWAQEAHDDSILHQELLQDATYRNPTANHAKGEWSKEDAGPHPTDHPTDVHENPKKWGDKWLTKERKQTGHRHGDIQYRAAAHAFNYATKGNAGMQALHHAIRQWTKARHLYKRRAWLHKNERRNPFCKRIKRCHRTRPCRRKEVQEILLQTNAEEETTTLIAAARRARRRARRARRARRVHRRRHTRRLPCGRKVCRVYTVCRTKQAERRSKEAAKEHLRRARDAKQHPYRKAARKAKELVKKVKANRATERKYKWLHKAKKSRRFQKVGRELGRKERDWKWNANKANKKYGL